MNKGDLTNNNDNKAHARKGESLVEFSAKNIFQILQKFKIYFLPSKSVFCPLRLKVEWWLIKLDQAAQLKYK